jgi:hypothetical protein
LEFVLLHNDKAALRNNEAGMQRSIVLAHAQKLLPRDAEIRAQPCFVALLRDSIDLFVSGFGKGAISSVSALCYCTLYGAAVWCMCLEH